MEIGNVEDALLWIRNAGSVAASGVVLHDKNLCAEFFDLKSGLAGAVLQTYANYGVKLAIVGDFAKYCSKTLNAFIFECNRGRHIFFTRDADEALQRTTNP